MATVEISFERAAPVLDSPLPAVMNEGMALMETAVRNADKYEGNRDALIVLKNAMLVEWEKIGLSTDLARMFFYTDAHLNDAIKRAGPESRH